MKDSLTEFEPNRIFYLCNDKDSIDNKNNKEILEKELKTKVKVFSSVDEFFNSISKERFILIYVVLNEDLFEDFFEIYNIKIKHLMIVLANIIICKNIFEHYNKKYVNDLSFNPGGITDNIRNVVKYIKDIQNYYFFEKKDDKISGNYIELGKTSEKYEYIFIPIKKLEDLIIPTLMGKLNSNTLINDAELYNFQKLLLCNYSDSSIYIFPSKEKNMKVPYEILSKYFLFLYTMEGPFYKDLNRILTNKENKKIYNELINVFLYSLHNGGFENCSTDELYRGSIMAKKEFDEINNLFEKIKNNNNEEEVSEILLCSTNFLSFSKSLDVAENFLDGSISDNKEKIEKGILVPYKYIIKEIQNPVYFVNNIMVEANNTAFPREQEVLFLPYSCFLVDNITADEDDDKIKIIYLKYLDSFQIKIEKKIKELASTEQGIKKLEKIMVTNQIGKLINGPNDNTNEQFEDYMKDEIGVEIKCEKPDLNTDFEDPNIIFVPFEPTNLIKKHVNNNTVDGVLYNVEEKDIDEDGYVNILGKNFVEENNNKVSLIINGKEENLCYKYKLNKGENTIKFIFKEEIKNYSYLFYECTSLSDIYILKDWDVSNATNLTCLFYGCSSLKNISGLKNWNVKNVNHFSYLFYGCTSLKNISALKNWDVSGGMFFTCLFYGCTSLKDISALKNWNVSKGIYFNYLFYGCTSLKDISALKDWNVRNGNYLSYFFYGCTSLTNISPLKNWDVSNGYNFSYFFCNCDSLTDITPLKSWDVRNGLNFISMFDNCPIINETKPFWIYKTN